jgi:hypothetical protein
MLMCVEMKPKLSPSNNYSVKITTYQFYNHNMLGYNGIIIDEGDVVYLGMDINDNIPNGMPIDHLTAYEVLSYYNHYSVNAFFTSIKLQASINLTTLLMDELTFYDILGTTEDWCANQGYNLLIESNNGHSGLFSQYPNITDHKQILPGNGNKQHIMTSSQTQSKLDEYEIPTIDTSEKQKEELCRNSSCKRMKDVGKPCWWCGV